MLHLTSNLLTYSQPRIVILGGGAIGLSTALHLLQSPSPPEVTIVERDFSYARNSAALSAGGVRTQFSLRENVECSLYGLDVFKDGGLGRLIKGVGGGDAQAEPIDVQFMQGGYLFLASSEDGEQRLRSNLDMQRGCGSEGTVMMGLEEVLCSI